MPYGFGRSLVFNTDDNMYIDSKSKLPDKIDVLFFGRFSFHRKNILDAIINANVKNVYISDWLFGKERDVAVKRAKIVLNLRYWGHDKIYESKMSRLIYLMANAKCIIS